MQSRSEDLLCLHHLVAAQIARTPSAVALVSGSERLTYRELGRRAGELARRLAALGVGPEARVAVCLSRTPAMVVALLGILEAGGAYVPLDPAYPPERLALMLEDAGAAVIVTETALAARLPASRARVLLLDGDPDPVNPANTAIRVQPGNLAYLIYTSGSTGKPKAVAIEHRSAVAFVRWALTAFDPAELASVLAATSISFDLSIFELFVPLACGGQVVLAGNILALPELATEVALVNTVPSAMAELMRAGALPAGVRAVNLAGEPLKGSLAQALYASGVERVRNLYGPSEDTTYSTFEAVDPESRGEPTIGRPIAGTWVRLLDAELRLVPAGEAGEICLGGAGLARGYLGRPELTAERFVPDAWDTAPGARLYRTGDLARSLPDGRLEFLGRLDQQVKVRGFRIELGEIEAALAAHPGVREAVVVVLGEPGGDRSLAAYVVPDVLDGEPAPTAGALRDHLRTRLAEVMVPSSFTRLERLPRTPNGKVDRNALPPPESGADRTDPSDPADPITELLAGIWAEVLGRAELPGPQANFFELGGHSLLATRVVSRVRAALGVELPFSALLQTPVLAAFATRVEQALTEGRPAPPPIAPIATVPRSADGGGEPLSFAQQRLWFLHRLEPGSAVYNLPLALRLTGPLDAGALERSLDEVFRRHEVLRTTFVEGPDGEPLQIVAPFRPAGLPRVDLAGLPPAAVRAEADRQTAREARRPFDLVRGPVVRAFLLRLGAQEHHLLVSCHHIAFDGWSAGVLRRELSALYGGSPLPEPAFQYRDFAVWQRRWLSGETLAAQLAYWRQRLAGAPGVLELPADRPRPPVQSFRGATLALAVPAGLAAGIASLARSEAATLFMTALAAFSALLGRFTGQTDLVVGSPVANRTAAGLDDLLGFFVNTLALRADLGGDPPFRTLLGRVRETALSAYAHQDLPFERLVEELQPERDPSRSPLFQVMLALDLVHEGDLAPGLGCEPLRVDTGTAMFDLSLFLEDTERGLTAFLEYAADLFDASTVERLGRSFLALLSGLVEEGAGLRVSDLPLLGAGESWQIVGEWNEPGLPVEDAACLHDLVAAQIARTPSAVALVSPVSDSERLTYREVGLRAGELARRLAALGVGPEVRVGVCLSRSPSLVTALLGILAAGGAYVPLDPAYPRERLELMLEDSGAAVLLTETALAARLPVSQARVLLLDGEPARPERVLGKPHRWTLTSVPSPIAPPPAGRGAPAPVPAARPSVRFPPLPADGRASSEDTEGGQGGEGPTATFETPSESTEPTRALPGNLAYLIYTSGSTGKPKAVAIEHRSAVAFVRWSLAAFAPAELASVLAATSISFDLSVFELFVPLACGGQVVLAENALALPELPAGGEIVLVNTVPSAMAELVRAGTLPPGVRAVNLAGEPLKGSLAQALFASGVERVRNLYGPSEDTTYSTFEVVEPGSRREPTIGRPISGTWVRLLDAELRLVPVGVPGELYLGGAGLARGYLGRPELTAERFVPDPLSRTPGARLYRTGDLARYLPDGRLEYLGRLDHQVKVRGFRIELGEIEAALLTHPGVREAVVVALGEPGGDRSLAAYVVLDEPAPPAGELRDHLRTRLAEYMVPSHVIRLEQLPLTPNGKVDRKALPAPESGARGTDPADWSDPTTELLAGIWAEVLERAELPGLRDNFFELSGHSLLAARVVSRVRAALGVELPFSALLQAPVLAAFVARVKQALADGRPAPPPIIPILAIPRPADGEGEPLSFAQQRLWFLYRLEPESAVYNLPLALRLTGPLDAGCLERSLNEVFRRHEVLRTTFVEGPDGEPRQIVAPFHPAGLPRVDLAGLPPAAARAEADRQTTREARRPFDLVRGPVARAFLLRLGAQEHHLLVSCHHIAFDGWSAGVLRRELSALYGGSPLPEPAFQYRDFAVWQRRWLSGETLAAQLAYWRQRLAGAPGVLELPADRPRPPVQSFRGATLALAVPAGLAAGIASLARSEGATLFMTALAAFSALLGRFTGQMDLVVGSPVANRTAAGLEDLLGFFVNTLALRVDLGGDPPFRTLLGRVRETALSAYAHQDLPFERLVEELQPERDPSRSPLFQVMLALDLVHEGDLAPGLSCEPLRIDTGTAMFDLSLFLEDTESGLTAYLEYAADLFDASTVERLGRSFLALLSGLLEEGAGLRVSDLPLLGAGESWQIVGEWNEPGLPVEDAACLHDLVAAQIARTPSAVALVSPVSDSERLTYREVGLRAGELARRLAALGVGPEVRVGVCLSRSPSLVTALLGILAAGGAYVPLDPAYPRERLELMLEDSGAAVLLTETALAARLPASRARVLLLDEPEDVSFVAEGVTSSHVQPGNLAYLIYTSGSTGKPKAVAIEHRSAVAFVRWSLAAFAPAELASVLAATSISFDLSVFELFVPLACGGQVVLAENALALPELPGANKAVLVNTVPSATAELVRAGALPPGVRSVNLAGEPLKGSLAQALFASGVERVRNLYGPSEDTTYSTFEVVEPESRREPTIGRPIAGTWVRLLDAELRLVPVGVPGELYLGGAGLARGYLGRPELTAERFVPDPLSRTPGARLYRTGDLARYLPDGKLEYLGRLDHQVKVRGFRIELGEIEAALLTHPGVREAVVVALGEPGGDRSLAAYVVLNAVLGEPAPTAGALRDHLRTRLAEYMVPSHVIRLEQLPLTPNGKVDRKALPAPESGARGTGPTEPSDPTTELLAGIWAEVLGLAELPGPQDNFFELGGHSLLATRVVSRVRAALGVELPFRTLFAAPTVATLAAALVSITSIGAPPAPGIPLEPLADRSDLPLSFAQQRLWLLDRLEPGSPVYNLPLPHCIRGPLVPAFLERALGEVVRRHEVLRTTFAVVAGSGEPRPVLAASGAFSLPRVDLSGLPAPARTTETARLLDEEAARPFDLATGPLVRAALLATGAAEHALLMTMHHIAGDGWSIDLLLGELSALYRAFAAGLPSPLPELAIQYADFAAWQRRWLTGPLLESQLAYWRRQLTGAPEALDLPTDHPRPAIETSRGAHFTTPLPPALVAGIRALSRRQGATLFMVLLAAFAALLERLTGEPDVLVGSPVANRGRTELEGLVGFFVNSLVLRADLSGDPRFDVLLARVREAALGAYAHQDLPFERLVEELQPQRSLARSPLFQVQLVLGVGEGRRELAPGLPLIPLPFENRTAKYDLALALDVQDGELLATLEYRTDLFERTTMVRWLGGFEALLQAIVERPEERLSALPLLAVPERQILLHEWNDTAAPEIGSEELIHHLFESQVRRTPEATALIASGAKLTYAELNAAADRLAGSLRRRGVGPDVPVAVCLERSADLVVALLGILKAGGAYVPIDPNYPEERRKFLLADSGATIVLTSEDTSTPWPPSPIAPPAPGRGGKPAVLLCGGAPLPAEGGAMGEGTGVRSRNLAYLIYTSGSTGRPKGVAIEHRSAVALIHWARGLFPPEDLTAVLAATSICFDLSVFEIFVPLSWGGSIHLADNALALASSPVGEGLTLINSTLINLTLINTVPSAMAELVHLGAVPPTVRTVNLAGEPLPRALVDRIYELGTVERVLNLYGPSEDTTYSTWSVIPRGVSAAPSIGRPVSGTRAYLIDRHLELSPLGIPGELVLSGAGLARGYHGRPDLTAERFLPDPFAAEPGGRIYRTGDLARSLPNGEIDFLGRIDHQVKVRGFRIELGEVEAVLAAHPSVERAVAGTHAYGPQDLRLVAWVAAGTPVEPEELRAWVGKRLPEFMVPSAVVVLPTLPLTPNGKVDRRALPPPIVSAATATGEPPRSPLEELVAGLWTELLSSGRPGLHDDFFALGGHSLLAIRMLARLRTATGVDLSLRTLFAHPTVATLAAEVERNLRAPGAPPLPPIEPNALNALIALGDDAPASAAQERLWLFHQLDPHGSVLNVPHALRLTGPLQPAALAASLTDIARRQASLRTSFAYGAGGLRQRIAPWSPVALPLIDLRALPSPRRDDEARRVSDEEARQPFDLAMAPLWRARLLRLSADDHLLLVTFHHTIVDGWSLDLFNRELAAIYAMRAGSASAAPLRPHPLPPLPSPPHPPGEGDMATQVVWLGTGGGAPLPVDGGVMGEGSGVRFQYTDFAVWQRRWLTAETLAPQLAYWRRQLAGMPPVLDLPTDRPRPARQSFRGAVHWLYLPAELSAGAREIGRREGSTLFMTVFAAFAALLGRYTGRTDVVLGSPAANRHRPGTEGIIGFFVDNLVLRLDLGGDPTFRELLHRAREVALGAYANPDLPFEHLVTELDAGRDKSRNPLVQVLLLVQAAPTEPLRLGPVSAEPVEVHTATSQFDLTLAAFDGPRGIALEAEYSTDLFTGETIDRLLAHLSLLLAAVVANPEVRFSALPAEIAPRQTEPTHQSDRSAQNPPPIDDRARRQADLAASRSKLTPEQQALLQQRLRARGSRAAAPAPPAPASLVAIQPTGSRPPFFCVHPAGGDVLCFQALSRHLGTDQPFYGLQSRGLGAGEEPLASIAEMAAAYRAEITKITPGPYYLGGWSLGGAVVFELARQLAAEGKEVALLAIVDGTPGPWPPGDAADDADEDDDTRWLMDIADYLQRLWGVDLGVSPDVLRALPPDEQARRFLAGLKDTPFGAGAGVESLRRLLRVFKTNVRAFRRFRPDPYPGKITLFRPSAVLGYAGNGDEAAAAIDPTLGWGALSPRRIAIETVPGDHITALAEPHVRSLAARLRTLIEETAQTP